MWKVLEGYSGVKKFFSKNVDSCNHPNTHLKLDFFHVLAHYGFSNLKFVSYVPETLVSEISARNGFPFLKDKLKEDFLHFLTNFWNNWMIFQIGVCRRRRCKTLQNLQICQKFGKNKENPFSTSHFFV